MGRQAFGAYFEGLRGLRGPPNAFKGSRAIVEGPVPCRRVRGPHKPCAWRPRGLTEGDVGGSVPAGELALWACARQPLDPSSYRHMRCLGCPALGESTLRVFGVCVCPVAALRAPGAMLRR